LRKHTWVTSTGRTFVVELSSIVTDGNVDLGEVAGTGDLDIVLRLDKVRSGDSTFGHDAGTVLVLGAVCDCLVFAVTDRGEPR